MFKKFSSVFGAPSAPISVSEDFLLLCGKESEALNIWDDTEILCYKNRSWVATSGGGLR